MYGLRVGPFKGIVTEKSSRSPVAKNSNTNKQQQSKGVYKIVAENE